MVSGVEGTFNAAKGRLVSFEGLHRAAAAGSVQLAISRTDATT